MSNSDKIYPDSFNAIVLGGGFAGVYAAKTLGRALKKKGKPFSIAIVSEENHMVFQPMLAEVAGAALSPRHVVNPIRSLCREANIFKAQATKIDLESQTVGLSVGDFAGPVEFQYDQLALCLGSKIDLSRTPGMQEHALVLQNAGDAMRIRARFIARIEEARLSNCRETRRRLLSFVIVGGGYSGVETAGQLMDLARVIPRQYKTIQIEDFRFTLIHSREHLLPTLNRSLAIYTERHLKSRGLDIRLERRAKAVTANHVYMDDGQSVETNTVICTVGNAPHPLITQIATKHNLATEHGRLLTQSDCSVDSALSLWAAGDCASVPQTDGNPSPPTAQFALRQGELLGRNIARRLNGTPTRPFTFQAIGELATIGHHSAVAEIKGMRFSGIFAWWLWRTIYLAKLPGIERKLRVAFDWTLELFFPRDINLLNPRYTSEISETYLEAGDTLFEAGDPAFSFYIIKSGSIELLDGNERVTVVRQNQHFGERALLEKRNFLFKAVALEPTTLVAIRSSVFEQIVQADYAFSNFLTQSARAYLTPDELDTLLDRIPEERLESPVNQFMIRSLVKIDSGDSIAEALNLFKTHSKSHIPIIDASGIPIGVLLKESLYMQALSSDLDRNQSVDTLRSIQLPQLSEDATLREALTVMARANTSKILALNDAGKLTGIISIIDIIEVS